MSNKRSRKSAVDQDRSMMEGVKKYLMNQPLILGRKVYQPQEILDLLARRITTGQAILDTRTAVTAAIKADDGERKETSAPMTALKAIVQAMFNDVPEALAVFGLKARKTPKKTVAVKVEAAAKSLATKKARGYLGKKQRKRITGKTRLYREAPLSRTETVTGAELGP